MYVYIYICTYLLCIAIIFNNVQISELIVVLSLNNTTQQGQQKLLALQKKLIFFFWPMMELTTTKNINKLYNCSLIVLAILLQLKKTTMT